MNQSYTSHSEKVKRDLTPLNFREILYKYLRQWKWFVLAISIFVGFAFIYLRYSNRIYLSQASIIIEDDKNNGGVLSDMALFQDMGWFGQSSEIINEIEILKSRTLIEGVAKELKLNRLYIFHGTKTGFHKKEL